MWIEIFIVFWISWCHVCVNKSHSVKKCRKVNFWGLCKCIESVTNWFFHIYMSLEFLDVTVTIEHGNINTTIYSKETDKHMYLHAKSDHPATTKKAIAHGLGVRAKRICSRTNDYKNERQTIQTNLERRGYKKKYTDKSLMKVDDIDRTSLLEYKTRKQTNERVPMCVTYNRGLPNIQQILHERLPILHRSSRMKGVFPSAPITAFIPLSHYSKNVLRTYYEHKMSKFVVKSARIFSVL